MTTTTAPEKLAPELKITVTRRTLARALAIAKIAASNDKTLPYLNAVNLDLTERGNLVAQGTDRYMMARAHLQPLDPAEHNDDFAAHGVTVPLRTVTFLEKWFPLVDGPASPVEVAYTAKTGLTVQSTGAPTPAHLEVLADAAYPKLGTIAPSDETVTREQDRTGATVLSTRLLARVGRIAAQCDRHDHVLLRPGKKDVGVNDLVFRIADGDTVWADGLVMGIRISHEAPFYQRGL